MAEVLFVGTGDAFGSGGRRNSAILVREAGAHAPARLRAHDADPGLKELGVDPLEIDAVALSHFHGDHIAGLPFLLLDYVYGHPRERPLEVLGPPGVEEQLAALTRAYHYEQEQRGRYPIRFSEFSLDKPLEVAGFRVTPMPAVHQAYTCPHMLRVDAGAAVAGVLRRHRLARLAAREGRRRGPLHQRVRVPRRGVPVPPLARAARARARALQLRRHPAHAPRSRRCWRT